MIRLIIVAESSPKRANLAFGSISAARCPSIVAICSMHQSRIAALFTPPDMRFPYSSIICPVGRPGLLLSGPRGGRSLLRQPDIPGKPDCLERANKPKSRVELIPFETECGRIGEGLVIVLPSLAPYQSAKPRRIAAVVERDVERTRAEQVKKGVHSRHRMFHDEEPNHATPQKTLDEAAQPMPQPAAD